VYGLPKERPAEAMQGEFRDYVMTVFGEERIEFTYVISNYTLAYSLDIKLKEYEHRLWHYNQRLSQ
jgi:hypothetical protein